MKTTFLLQLLAALSLVLLAPSLRAQTTYVVNSTTIANYPASGPMTIINADHAAGASPPGLAPYNRWFITAQTGITAIASGAFSVSMQARFRLVDTTGAVVPCTGADANGYVAGPFAVFAGANAGLFGTSRSVSLVPVASFKLNPALFYRVEAAAIIVGRGGLQDTGESGYDYRFVHFTGPNASDAPANVVGYLESGGLYSKTYALKTQSSNTDFSLNVPYTFYRYDDPDVVTHPSAVTARFLVELFDTAAPATPIPLVASTTDVVINPANHAIAGFIIPSILTGTQSLKFQPAAGIQLDAAGKTYFAKVTLSHLEEAADFIPLPDNSRSLAHTHLLPFNGKLIFGQATANPIATTFTSITNNPALAAVLNGTVVDTALSITAASVDGTGHTFTSPGLNVSLLANGDSWIRGASSVTLTPPTTPDRDSAGGVRFDRTLIVLNSSGGTAGSISTILPAGMGWSAASTSKVLQGRFLFNNVLVNQQLEPAIPALTWLPSGGTGWVMEESKPMLIGASQVIWTVASGRFDITAPVNHSAYVRGVELTQLETSPVSAAFKIMRSNEQYWRWARNSSTSSAIQAGVQGGAEFTGGYSFTNLTATPFRTHFPYAASMVVSTGQANIVSDQMVSSTSTLILAASSPNVTMPWLSGCLDPSCGASIAPVVIQTFTPDSRTLRLTPDGGLVGAGTFSSGLNLRWGYVPAPLDAYAHRVTTTFTQGTFAMSGIFLKGSANPAPGVNDGPGVILLSGADATSAAPERPATNAYAAGRAEYPGFNLRLGADDATPSGITGASTLAGKPYGPYALKKRCKYGVRAGGVSGIHDKVAGPAETTKLYGYDFNLTNFGLSFLDNSVHESRVNGRVVVPKPSEIFVDFEELKFFCNGGLDKAKIASSTPQEKLQYWQAPIDILAMQFIAPSSCDPTEAYLALGLNSYSSHITSVLSGTVGFLSNGNLINKQFSDSKGPDNGLAGLDSRFKVPSQIKFQGPKRHTSQGGFEDYIFTSATDAYLNITGVPGNGWAHDPPEGAETGFWNFGGRLKVAFFESPKIHLQTTANLPPADPNDPDPAHATSWQTSIIKIANGTWDTGASETSYFDPATYHDTWNRGMPYPLTAQGSGESLHEYVTKPAYLPVARQSWLSGAIEFKYKLLWTSSTRSFTTLDASKSQESDAAAQLAQQMVIVKIDHRLPYLSAERAELTFGASYAGIPKISVTNFVLNEIDDGTGIFKAATDALCGEIFVGIEKGLGSIAKLLNDQSREFFTEALDPALQPVRSNLYTQLKANWNNPNQAVWAANMPAVMNTAFDSVRSNLQSGLQTAGNAGYQMSKIREFLTDTEAAIGFINNGLLAENANHDIELARNLTKQLILLLSKELGGTTNSLGLDIENKISELIDPLIKDAQPTIADIKDVLVQLNSILGTVKKALDSGADFATELSDIVNQQLADLNGITSGVKTEMTAFLLAFEKGVPGKNFLALSEEAFTQKIEQAIYDRFFGTQLVARIQTAIKQRLQDVEASIRSGLDSVFAEINKVIKKAISGLLSEVDDTINGVLGDFGKYLGSGSIQGSATFNGEGLRRLRMDGKFEFKVPDSVKLEGFVEINQYTSKDTPPGCQTVTGTDSLTEVTIGAINVPTDFISPGVKMNLTGKFSFITNALDKIHCVGLAGGIEMAQGPINFEAFKITKLAVGIAFGKEENYFSAGLGIEMQSWRGNGGVFFGRTCTLDPIMLWDPFAAKALGKPNPSFTGIYVYGEVHIPVSEVLLGIPSTCFFEVGADAGVGFFVFAEGPTYGARMALGVDGRVACLLGISGRIDLLGGKVNGKTQVTGKGEFCATLFWIDVCKDVTISTAVSPDGSLTGNSDTK